MATREEPYKVIATLLWKTSNISHMPNNIVMQSSVQISFLNSIKMCALFTINLCIIYYYITFSNN